MAGRRAATARPQPVGRERHGRGPALRSRRAPAVTAGVDDPLVMYLVVRRGAVAELARAGALASAAAVACVRAFAADPRFAAALQAWRPRPRKVCLRARGGQWRRVIDEPHAGAPEAGVIALPPCRRSACAGVVGRLQAMSTELAPAPARAAVDDDRAALTYVVNPTAPMSSGKSLAQIAHAA